MITQISIENFKGVGKWVEIPVRPITLLFGANSAGKSTVVHALQYAREVLVRRNLNVDRTESGGGLIDLGGFLNLLHGHDRSAAVTMQFALDLTDRDLPTYGEEVPDAPRPDLSLRVLNATVGLSVRWSENRQAPYVARYAVTINDIPVGEIRCDGQRSGYVHLCEVNPRHPIFLRADDDDFSLLDPLFGAFPQQKSGSLFEPMLLEGSSDALPDWNAALPLLAERLTPSPSPQYQSSEADEESSVSFDEDAMGLDIAINVLSHLMVGPGKLLSDYMSDLRYVGPLRATPPRNYTPPRYPDESRWADGMAGWDELFRDPQLAQKVSDWMSDKERLDAGCSLMVQRVRLLDEDSELYQLLSSGRAFDDAEDLPVAVAELPVDQRLIVLSESGKMLPQDVGVGISQLLPVVVALLSSNDRPIAIEQPELHVHPRLQAEIGDVLIEASREPFSKQLFIETHSEHLILRLLRRIRETTFNELPTWHPGLRNDRLSVVYLTGGEEPTKAMELRVTSDGDFIDRWPNGFFDERAEELF